MIEYKVIKDNPEAHKALLDEEKVNNPEPEKAGIRLPPKNVEMKPTKKKRNAKVKKTTKSD